MAQFNQANRVVVGIDGSAASEEALIWAAEESRVRGAVLEIDHVWSLPNLGYGGFVAQIDDFEKDAKELLERVTDQARKNHPDLTIESNLLEGPPAPALIVRGKRADLLPALIVRGKRADLLVVGSRGHGGFAGLMLGSVSQQLVHHAEFPIVVVHPSKA
ncbi:MAG: universal stress protein [Actinomycetota bacterium]|nr:universal stress protein [Actinomycetota bacterium]